MKSKKWKLIYVYEYASSKFCLHARVKKNGLIKFKTTHFVPQWKYWAIPQYIPLPKMDIEKAFKELLTPPKEI